MDVVVIDIACRVRHGTVCVGMGLDDLMPLTAMALLYGNQERQPSPHHDDEEGDGEELSLLESLNDSQISRAMWRRRDPEASNYLPPPNHTQFRYPEPLPPAIATSNRDGRVWPTEFTWPPLEPATRSQLIRTGNRSPTPAVVSTLESGMRITMDQSEDVNWPEEPTTAAVLADRQRRERHARDEDFESDRSSQEPPWDSRFRTPFHRLRRGIRHARDIRAVYPHAVGDSKKPLSKDVTQVRFSIEHGKNKVAIKFDPPV